MLKRTLSIIAIVLLVAYLAAAGIIYSTSNDEARCRGLRVVVTDSTELAFVSAADILAQLKRDKVQPAGLPIDQIDTYGIGRLVASRNRLVRTVKCYHTPDSLLRIDIEQRHPIMRVVSSVDGEFYIDTDGEAMPVGMGVALRLPLATGYVRRSTIQSTGLYDLARYLQQDRFWRSSLTQIHVASSGDVTLVPRVGNHVIVMGTLDDFEQKLSRVRTFYKKVMPRRGWNAYSVLNVSFDGQVVAERNESK